MIFGAVVGHERVREQLRGALARGAVQGGYLFSGPAGVGKRLVARDLLRAWLCRGGAAAPCGACESCRVFDGAHPDFLQVVPPENRKSISVDQVRELGGWIATSAALCGRKAAIVDPAEAMTLEAANALLKTLEEPPAGRVIVLVAARAGALAPTVRSRCRLVSFGELDAAQVAEVLRRSGWPPQAARQAAEVAEGSPGAALARDGRAWQDAVEAVRGLFDALAAGERGAALAFAEAAGEERERALTALRAIAGFARQAVRQALGGGGAALPPLLAGMAPAQAGALLAGALEAQRRLEGDRPPNAKLALATLLGGAAPAGAGR